MRVETEPGTGRQTGATATRAPVYLTQDDSPADDLGTASQARQTGSPDRTARRDRRPPEDVTLGRKMDASELRAATAGAAIPAPAALHLFDRPARTEPDLDLDDLEVVHAKGAQDAAEPLARPLHVEHPLHVRRPAAVTAVSRPVSSSPSPDAAR